jgi:hypothetical protein
VRIPGVERDHENVGCLTAVHCAKGIA